MWKMCFRAKKGVNHPRPHDRVFTFERVEWLHDAEVWQCLDGQGSRRVCDAAVVARRLRKVSFSLTTLRGLFGVPHWCLYWWRAEEQVSSGWTEKGEIARRQGAIPVKTRHYHANDAVAQTRLFRRLLFVLIPRPSGWSLTGSNEKFVA